MINLKRLALLCRGEATM